MQNTKSVVEVSKVAALLDDRVRTRHATNASDKTLRAKCLILISQRLVSEFLVYLITFNLNFCGFQAKTHKLPTLEDESNSTTSATATADGAVRTRRARSQTTGDHSDEILVAVPAPQLQAWDEYAPQTFLHPIPRLS